MSLLPDFIMVRYTSECCAGISTLDNVNCKIIQNHEPMYRCAFLKCGQECVQALGDTAEAHVELVAGLAQGVDVALANAAGSLARREHVEDLLKCHVEVIRHLGHDPLNPV